MQIILFFYYSNLIIWKKDTLIMLAQMSLTITLYVNNKIKYILFTLRIYHTLFRNILLYCLFEI